MRKYFCDRCGKELKEKEIKIFHGFDMEIISSEEVCSECIEILEKKKEEVAEERKKLSEEYSKKMKEIEEKILGEFK